MSMANIGTNGKGKPFRKKKKGKKDRGLLRK